MIILFLCYEGLPSTQTMYRRGRMCPYIWGMTVYLITYIRVIRLIILLAFDVYRL
jgi:hypothetical protein